MTISTDKMKQKEFENHKPEEIAKTKSEGIPKTDVTSGDFVLDEKKIDIAPEGYGNHNEFVYPEKDIKEFIKRLKDYFKGWGEENFFVINKRINNLAGKDLI